MSNKSKKEFENAVKSFESAKSWKDYLSSQLKSKESFESITGFIDYLYSKFGELSHYLKGYLETVTKYIENTENNLPSEKREKLLVFFKEHNLDVQHRKEMRYVNIYLPCCGMIHDFLNGLKIFKGGYSKEPNTRNFEIVTENRLNDLEQSIIDFLIRRNDDLVKFPEVFGDLEILKTRIAPFIEGKRFTRLNETIDNALLNDESKQVDKNHTDIFKDNGFVLFDYLYKNKKTDSIISDIGYFYRSMEDEFLKVGEAKFRKWILGEYSIEMGKIKAEKAEMDNKYNARAENYKEGLEWFKSTSYYRNKNGTKTK